MGNPMKIAFDTNILIDFLEGIEPQSGKMEIILSSIMKGQDEGVISTVSVAEILTGFYMADATSKAQIAKKLLNDLTINGFSIVPVTFEVADLAAQLRAKRGGKLPDALIIATAINQKANLIYSQDKGMQRYNKEIKTCQLL
jgi:predicted nucleic acid-binding protein